MGNLDLNAFGAARLKLSATYPGVVPLPPSYKPIVGAVAGGIPSQIEYTLGIARLAHAAKDQRRKYTDEEYIVHPMEVATILRTIDENPMTCGDINPVMAALLHDTVEDTFVTLELLGRLFNPHVVRAVEWLTDKEWADPKPNRATRKEVDRQRIAAAPGWVQNVKVADLISNTSTIAIHDPDFAKVYMKEKARVLDACTNAHPLLLEHARIQIEAWELKQMRASLKP